MAQCIKASSTEAKMYEAFEEGLMEMEFESVFGGWVGFQQKEQRYSGKRKCLEQRHGKEKHDHVKGSKWDIVEGTGKRVLSKKPEKVDNWSSC